MDHIGQQFKISSFSRGYLKSPTCNKGIVHYNVTWKYSLFRFSNYFSLFEVDQPLYSYLIVNRAGWTLVHYQYIAKS